MYTAVILNQKSYKLLFEVYGDLLRSLSGFQTQTAQGEPLPHHATLHFGDFNSELNDIQLLGQEIVMDVVSFASDYRVAAFGLDFKPHNEGAIFGNPGVFTVNKRPHITAAINQKEGGKPYYSNMLIDWKPVSEVVQISGILQVFGKKL